MNTDHLSYSYRPSMMVLHWDRKDMAPGETIDEFVARVKTSMEQFVKFMGFDIKKVEVHDSHDFSLEMVLLRHGASSDWYWSPPNEPHQMNSYQSSETI